MALVLCTRTHIHLSSRFPRGYGNVFGCPHIDEPGLTVQHNAQRIERLIIDLDLDKQPAVNFDLAKQLIVNFNLAKQLIVNFNLSKQLECWCNGG